MSYPTVTIGRVRILHTADWHVGRSIRGRSRTDEHRAVLAEIADVARREAVDLVLVAGDTFDVVAPSAESERIVYQALLDLSDIAPVVLIAGNHDHPRRWRAVAPLFEMGRVTVGATLQRPDEGGVARIQTDAGETARIALVPFVGKRGIVTADDLMALDPFEHGGKYAGRVEAILDKLTEGMTSDDVNLVVAHLMIAEGRLGGGERIAFTVEDYAIPATAFSGSLSYVALGHLHRMQSVPAPAPVWYAGSPMQLDFGERDDEKGLLVVDAEPGLPATVRPVPLTAGRRLIQLAGTLEELEVRSGEAELADAYLKIVVHESARAGLGDVVRELFPNAVDVLLASPRDIGATDRDVRLGRPPRELFIEYLEQVDASDDDVVALFDEMLGDIDAT